MAKITIQKKTKTNHYENLSQILNIPDLQSRFPDSSMEPWRRFDPVKLVPVMEKAGQNGFSSSKITIENNSTLRLKSAEEWKKEDELFLKKVMNKFGLFHTSDFTKFFENFINKSVVPENYYILRLSEKINSTSQIQITSGDKIKLNCGILFIYCEENSNTTLNIVKQSGLMDLSILYIYQEKNSNLHLRYLDENIEGNSNGVSFLKSFQEKNSNSDTGLYTTSAKQNKKIFIESSLMENADTKITGIHTGIYSHIDHDFFIKHEQSFSKSEVLFKMAVLDESYGIFWGDTEIIPETRGCEGYQYNKNLILGDSARVDAIPRLRIKAENVIASHGSATGEIAEDEIFYLMSRGLSYEDARKLLLRGFFEDVLRRSFGGDPEIADTFLAKIWNNIEKILGFEIH